MAVVEEEERVVAGMGDIVTTGGRPGQHADPRLVVGLAPGSAPTDGRPT